MTAESIPSIQVKTPPARKRGGQPGNTNAFKHGFYTSSFSLAERRGLQAANGLVLGDEIDLFRVLIRRFSDQILATQASSPTQTAQHLAVIGEAMLRLASLLRTDHVLGGAASSTFIQQLNLVLTEMAEEKPSPKA
jgi:hypothetical protein